MAKIDPSRRDFVQGLLSTSVAGFSGGIGINISEHMLAETTKEVHEHQISELLDKQKNFTLSHEEEILLSESSHAVLVNQEKMERLDNQIPHYGIAGAILSNVAIEAIDRLGI